MRDEGLAAFQRQDLPTAQARLRAAIQQNPQDGMAYLYFGGVAHQMGHHEEALQALHRAAQLLPRQPQVRYNLGIVQEKLGRNAEAFASYKQAVTLQPNYPLAQLGMQRLQSLMDEAADASSPVVIPAYPVSAPPPASYPQASGYTPAAPIAAHPADIYSSPSSVHSQPAGAPHGSYSPPPAGGYRGQQRPLPSVRASLETTKVDAFDFGQAFQDIFRILFSPKDFFAEEEGATGLGAPMAMLLAFSIIVCTGNLISQVFRGQPGLFIGVMAGGMAFAIPFVWFAYMVSNYVLSGLLYGLSRMFGGTGTFKGIFRACTYGWAPYAVASLAWVILSAIFLPAPPGSRVPDPLAPEQSNQRTQSQTDSSGTGQPDMGSPDSPYRSNYNSTYNRPRRARSSFINPLSNGSTSGGIDPITAVCLLVGAIWGWVVLGMGIKATQGISTDGAVGIVVIHLIVTGGILAITVAIFLSYLASLAPGQ